MSFILNALRKSEQERLAGENQKLEYQLFNKPDQPTSNKKSLWITMLLSINIILILFLTWFGLQHIHNNSSKETSKPIEPSKTTPAEVSHEKPIKPDLASNPHQLSIAKQITKKPVIKPQPIDLKPTVEKKLEKEKPKQNLNIHSQTASVNEKRDLNHQPKKEEILIKPPVQQKIPYLSELSRDMRRSIPEIKINAFVYAKNANDRFILANMEKFREGEEIAEGLILKKIESHSILVEYDGTQFKVRRDSR